MTVEVRGVSYYLNEKLKKKWNKFKNGKMAEWDEDRFYIVDGHEGAGKSLFTIQQAAFIDPTILDDENGKVLPRICFSVEEFLDAVKHTKSTRKETKCVIFDEAFRGMSSKTALSSTNKKLVEALMEVRQNNLVVFIVSPSFYLLELYPAVLRSKALFHVVKEKGTRLRYVRIFNYQKKAKLYQAGVRKAWGYPIKTKTKVRFFNKYPGGQSNNLICSFWHYAPDSAYCQQAAKPEDKCLVTFQLMGASFASGWDKAKLLLNEGGCQKLPLKCVSSLNCQANICKSSGIVSSPSPSASAAVSPSPGSSPAVEEVDIKIKFKLTGEVVTTPIVSDIHIT